MPLRLSAALRTMLAERLFRALAITCGVLLVFSVLLLAFKVPPPRDNAVVPLHYNIYFGVDQVGQWWQLFVPAGIVLLLGLFNVLVAGTMWGREQVLSYGFLFLTLVLFLFVAVQSILIVLLNISYA